MDTTSARHQSLLNEHARLDNQLAEEMKRVLQDRVVIQNIKKRKLRIKEEIQSIMEPG
jgi:hypothetical protein